MTANTTVDKLHPSSPQDRVECHSGHTYAERPTALIIACHKRAIDEILARWQMPGTRCFRVRVADQSIFELCYDEIHDEWQIVNV